MADEPISATQMRFMADRRIGKTEQLRKIMRELNGQKCMTRLQPVPLIPAGHYADALIYGISFHTFEKRTIRWEDLYIEDDIMPRKKKESAPVWADLCSLTAAEVNEWLQTLPRPPMAWEADFADKG